MMIFSSSGMLCRHTHTYLSFLIMNAYYCLTQDKLKFKEKALFLTQKVQLTTCVMQVKSYPVTCTQTREFPSLH